MRAALLAMFLTAALNTEGADVPQPGNKEWLPLGRYSCMTDRIVGIQGDRHKRFAGQIVVDQNWAKFTVKISKLPEASRNCRKENVGFDAHDAWFMCDTRYQAEFETSRPMRRMLGDSSNDFHGMRWERFNISPDGTYLLFRTNYEGGFYLNEGRCEALEGR